MTTGCIELFDGEKREAYFQASFVNEDKQRVSNRGSLYETYRTHRKVAIRLGYFVPRRSDNHVDNVERQEDDALLGIKTIIIYYFCRCTL